MGLSGIDLSWMGLSLGVFVLIWVCNWVALSWLGYYLVGFVVDRFAVELYLSWG